MITVENARSNPTLISARKLRITIGVLGFLLPTCLIIGAAVLQDCRLVQNSISAYYHTMMRDVFVGVLCSIALGMWAYKGYGKADNIAGTAAAFFTLGVAFLPTSVGEPLTDCFNEALDYGWIGVLHFISAACLFGLLAFFCLVLFIKCDDNPTPRKLKRNCIYKWCGWIIVSCILLIGLYNLVLNKSFPDLAYWRPVFFLEAIALYSFSFSWLVKGEVILGDK